MVGKVCTTDGFLCCIVIKTSQIFQSCLVTELVFILQTVKKNSASASEVEIQTLKQPLYSSLPHFQLVHTWAGTLHRPFYSQRAVSYWERKSLFLIVMHLIDSRHPANSFPLSAEKKKKSGLCLEAGEFPLSQRQDEIRIKAGRLG